MTTSTTDIKMEDFPQYTFVGDTPAITGFRGPIARKSRRKYRPPYQSRGITKIKRGPTPSYGRRTTSRILRAAAKRGVRYDMYKRMPKIRKAAIGTEKVGRTVRDFIMGNNTRYVLNKRRRWVQFNRSEQARAKFNANPRIRAGLAAGAAKLAKDLATTYT